MGLKRLMGDKKLLNKLAKMNEREILIYSYGVSKLAMQKGIREKELDQMIAQTKKHLPKLWNKNA